MFVTVVLKVLRPKEFYLGTSVVAWSVSGPVGFLLWVFAWKMYDGGAGHTTADAGAGATAFLVWYAWHRGRHLAWIERRILKGSAICLVVAMTVMSIKITIGSSTAPISPATLTSLTGSVLSLCSVISVKTMTLIRLFGKRILRQTWRFLNRPVALGFRPDGQQLGVSPPTKNAGSWHESKSSRN